MNCIEVEPKTCSCCDKPGFTIDLHEKKNYSSHPDCCPGTDYDCANYKILGYNKPKCDWGFKDVNKLGLEINKDFCRSGCGWITQDPRLFSAGKLQETPLDHPPLIDAVANGKNIYDCNDYSLGFYKNYKDINAGQIKYYTSNATANPYFHPVFTTETCVEKRIFKDPMDSYKPQYRRINNNSNLSPYTFINDTLCHRESIMESLMDKMNRQSWSARWESSEAPC